MYVACSLVFIILRSVKSENATRNALYALLTSTELVLAISTEIREKKNYVTH